MSMGRLDSSKGDLVQTYKILREMDRLDIEMFPLVGESQIRGHYFKIKDLKLRCLENSSLSDASDSLEFSAAEQLRVVETG